MKSFCVILHKEEYEGCEFDLRWFENKSDAESYTLQLLTGEFPHVEADITVIEGEPVSFTATERVVDKVRFK